MKLPLWETHKPQRGTFAYKFVKFFCDRINFCEGVFYDEYDQDGNPVPKPENKIYNTVYKYWTWPFVNPGCECCSAVRGLIYGAILGFVAGRFL